MWKLAASSEFLTHKGAGVQTQPFSPTFFLLCLAEVSPEESEEAQGQILPNHPNVCSVALKTALVKLFWTHF